MLLKPAITTLTAVVTLMLVTASVVVEAEQASKVPRVGFLTSSSSAFLDPASIRANLNILGYVEGKHILFEYRSAAGRDDRLPELAAELIRLKVDVMVPAGKPAILAAKAATTTIPIIVFAEDDPVVGGLVTSLARPGGNLTGMAVLLPELTAKRLELLRQTIPRLRRVGILWDPADADRAAEWNAARMAARALGLEVVSLEVHDRGELARVVDTARKKRVDALAVLESSMLVSNAGLVTALANRNRFPAIYPRRWFVDSFDHSGLMSYEPDPFDLSQRLAAYVDKILRGAKPGDLPMEQPTRFELVINLKTAKAIGLTIPPSVLMRTDHVIE